MSERHAAGDGGGGAEPPFRRLAVVGVGLIGGSVGLAVRGRWPGVPVVGIDSRDVLHDALAIGAITEVAGDVTAAAGADLIVLCAPLAANLAALATLAPLLTPGAVITDVSSTKRDIVHAADRLGVRAFVGGHPLAGAATSGTASARERLFRGRPWILTPSAATEASAIDRLRALAIGIGAAPTSMDAAAHDRLMAYVSHLPQVVASVLLETVGEAVGEQGIALSGPGLADTTRLASSPGALWAGILAANADHVASAIEEVEDALAALRSGLSEAGAIETTFAAAARWRRSLKLIGEAEHAPVRPTGVRTTPAVRTYLEQGNRPQANTPWPEPGWRLARVDACPPSLYRYLYREVGRPWQWIDRLPWSDDRIREHLATPGIEIWLASQETVPAGLLELARAADGSVEIVYFGLLPDFIGRRVGRAFLDAALREAWRADTTRVWLHTCTLDHPRALPNYLSAGFRVVRDEAYTARLEAVPAR